MVRYPLLACALIIGCAMASPAAAEEPTGWHRIFRYGTFDSTPQDVWDDLCKDVYGKGKLRDLYSDPHGLLQLGHGFWACPGCSYAPLHYESVRQQVVGPGSVIPGQSWYRGVPVGFRKARPLPRGAGPFDRSACLNSGDAPLAPRPISRPTPGRSRMR